MRHYKRPKLMRHGILKCMSVALASGVFGTGLAAAQEQANGALLFQQIDANSFRYNVDLQNAGTASLRTLWYAWQPGSDFMASSPANVTSPAGWNSTITHVGSGGYAIEWINTGGPLAAGQTLLGFGFDSHETPSTLSGTQVSTTFVYQNAAATGGSIPSGDNGFAFHITPPAHPWHNPFSSFDVNGNGSVNPQDFLQIINYIHTHPGVVDLPTPMVNDGPLKLIDVNNDGRIAPIDALQVANHLTPQVGGVQQSGGAQGLIAMARSQGSMSAALLFAPLVEVPEPGTVWLASAGASVLGIALWRKKYRGRK